ncbi:MAG: winged helix-turn-helix transcriptional regulator [Acidobacteria bacterium]|nr:winged helix-turn-helix transcriptional regulator [Acidobacteriota bacterium]
MPTEWSEIEAHKRLATLQVLFKVARLLNDKALTQLQGESGAESIRAAHLSLLPHIPQQGGIRLMDLANKVGVTKQAVFQWVEDLVGLGMLERHPDPEDRRSKRIGFTEMGRQAILHGLGVLQKLENEMRAHVPESDWQGFRNCLLRLHDVLTQDNPSPPST